MFSKKRVPKLFNNYFYLCLAILSFGITTDSGIWAMDKENKPDYFNQLPQECQMKVI